MRQTIIFTCTILTFRFAQATTKLGTIFFVNTTLLRLSALLNTTLSCSYQPRLSSSWDLKHIRCARNFLYFLLLGAPLALVSTIVLYGWYSRHVPWCMNLLFQSIQLNSRPFPLNRLTAYIQKFRDSRRKVALILLVAIQPQNQKFLGFFY